MSTSEISVDEKPVSQKFSSGRVVVHSQNEFDSLDPEFKGCVIVTGTDLLVTGSFKGNLVVSSNSHVTAVGKFHVDIISSTAKVEVHGHIIVHAHAGIISAFDHCRVNLDTKSQGYLHNKVTFKATDDVFITCYDNTHGTADDNSTVFLFQQSTLNCSCHCRVFAQDQSYAYCSDRCIVVRSADSHVYVKDFCDLYSRKTKHPEHLSDEEKIIHAKKVLEIIKKDEIINSVTAE
jgi:hypothetical protein